MRHWAISPTRVQLRMKLRLFDVPLDISWLMLLARLWDPLQITAPLHLKALTARVLTKLF